MILSRSIVWAAAFIALVGCEQVPPGSVKPAPVPTVNTTQQVPTVPTKRLAPSIALTEQQQLMSPPNVDASGVLLASLDINGQQYDVSSFSPVILARTGEGASEAATIIRFSADRTSLILFSRNPQTGDGQQVTLSRSQMKQKPSFTFPIISDGKLKPARVRVAKLIEQSAAPAATAPAQ